MLLNEDEVIARLNSPDNLVNRLKAMSVFRIPDNKPSGVVNVPPPIENLIEDLDRRVKTASIHEKALDLLSDSISELKNRLPEVDSVKSLASVARDMGVIVKNIETIENERRTNKSDGPKVQFVYYAPTILTESDFGPVVKVLE